MKPLPTDCKLQPLRMVGRNRQSNQIWRFRCSCGAEKEILYVAVASGRIKTCGCLRRETTARMGRATKTHGRHNTAEYVAWTQMLQRCRNSKHRAFKHYGGRGLAVCARWLSFPAFFKDMGVRPAPDLSLDRIRNDDGYWCGKTECPECGPAGRTPNCCWGTEKDQHEHRRVTVWLEYRGQTKTLVEWAKELGIPKGTAFHRYYQKRTPEQILMTGRVNARKPPTP